MEGFMGCLSFENISYSVDVRSGDIFTTAIAKPANDQAASAAGANISGLDQTIAQLVSCIQKKDVLRLLPKEKLQKIISLARSCSTEVSRTKKAADEPLIEIVRDAIASLERIHQSVGKENVKRITKLEAGIEAELESELLTEFAAALSLQPKDAGDIYMKIDELYRLIRNVNLNELVEAIMGRNISLYQNAFAKLGRLLQDPKFKESHYEGMASVYEAKKLLERLDTAVLDAAMQSYKKLKIVPIDDILGAICNKELNEITKTCHSVIRLHRYIQSSKSEKRATSAFKEIDDFLFMLEKEKRRRISTFDDMVGDIQNIAGRFLEGDNNEELNAFLQAYPKLAETFLVRQKEDGNVDALVSRIIKNAAGDLNRIPSPLKESLFAGATSIRELDFTTHSSRMDENQLQAILEKFPRLTRVILGSNLDDAIVKDIIALLKAYPKFAEKFLVGQDAFVSRLIQEVGGDPERIPSPLKESLFAAAPTIRKLDLSGCFFNHPDNIKAIVERFPQLDHIVLNSNTTIEILNEINKILQDYPKLAKGFLVGQDRLVNIIIIEAESDWNRIPSPLKESLLSAAPTIRKFHCYHHRAKSYRPFTADEMKAIVEKFPQLESIVCKGEIDNGVLAEVAKLSQLKELELSECLRIDDKGLQFLTSLRELTKLTLSRCLRITDAGMKHLARLEKLQNLKLSRMAQITDKGIQSLSRLKLKTLERE